MPSVYNSLTSLAVAMPGGVPSSTVRTYAASKHTNTQQEQHHTTHDTAFTTMYAILGLTLPKLTKERRRCKPKKEVCIF